MSARTRRARRVAEDATIKQVARDAKVSTATVSRVLTRKGPVSDEARRRVLAAAKRLRYVPHGAARSLITNRTGGIGVLLPDIYGEFFSELIRGLDLGARERGYHLLVSGSHSDRSEIETVLRAMRGLVDGVVVMTPEVDPRTLRANLAGSLPVVLIGSAGGRDSFDSIAVDNHGGAFAMTRHLLGLGRGAIAFVTGPPRNWEARERLRGYRDALRSRATPRPRGIVLPGDFTEESGFRAAKRALSLRHRPDAIFAANDSMAIGVLSALREAGVRIPEEIALGGFDDIPITRFISPALTTVRIPLQEVAARALDRLAHGIRMRNRHRHAHETLRTTLVVRSSCGSTARGTNRR